MEKITKETVLGDVIKIPGKESILAKHRVPCLSCPMASLELSSLKVGDVCEAYGLDCEKLLEELNNQK